MRLRIFLLAAVVILAAPTAFSQDAPKIEFEKYTLPNGLQVILHVDRKLPMVHVNSWYHVGSKNERMGRTGFARLFEHMMFEGSKDANGKYFTFIEQAGANLFEGGVNGTTNEDRTNYFETVPSANLEYVLWIESDRLATLTDVLTKAKLDNERDIVKNERRQGLENRPYGRAFMLIQQNVYPAGHPYSHDVIGSHEDLTAASVDDVNEFFKTYYTPNNLSLAITGDFDIGEAKRLIEKYYGPIPPGPALDRPKQWIPKLDAPKVVEVNDRVPQERSYLAWPSPALFDPDDGVLDLVQLILTDGLSSRLTRSLVYDRQLCTNVNSFQNSEEIAGFFGIIATARPGASLAQIEQIVGSEISRLAKDGPSAEELARAKTKWEFGFISGLERIGGFGGQADLLNQYNTFFGDPNKFAADLDRHRKVSAADVQHAVSRWLDTPNRVAVRFHPEVSRRPAAATLDRSKQPALGADRPFRAPEVKSARLDNGLQIFVVERKDLPKVNVMLATRAGSGSDPQGKEGLASLAVQVMRRGTRTRKAIDIDSTLGDLGTELTGGATPETASQGMEVLRRNLPAALGILADIVRSPSFPGDEVDREKKRRLDALAQANNDPNGIAQRVMPRLAYGANHPYGHPSQGFPATVATIAPEDFARFHSTYWKPGSSAIIFCGDITLPDATELARQSFGSWSGGAAPALSVPAPQPMGPGKVFLVNRAEAAQTVVAEILPGPTRTTSDYYALSLADTVWGGTAGARLGTNLREDKGYSYGVFSSTNADSKYGTWVASGGVQTNKTKESVVEFQKELKFIAGEKPVSEKEFRDARSIRVRGYAQQFESLDRVGGQVEELWVNSLPMTELQRETDELQKVTREAVNAAAEKYATPSRSTLLLVGDLAKIEAGIRELKIGEVVIVDTEGKAVK
ncbi:MAG TPA: pitrilysin family protein [Bryobacteraceae bacterium]|nr:pitrilysin family protein [Bryobacteraceae bacterium]